MNTLGPRPFVRTLRVVCVVVALVGGGLGVANLAKAADITVTSGSDSGANTLRDAVDNANDGDRIRIASGVTPTLASPISIEDDVTITSATSSPGTISGGDVTSIFEIPAGTTVLLDRLILTGGQGDKGAPGDPGEVGAPGAVANEGTLEIRNSTLSDNAAGSGGDGTAPDTDAGDGGAGAISNLGGLALVNTLVSGNAGGVAGSTPFPSSASTTGIGGPGAISNAGTLEVTNSTVVGNVGGDGVYVPDGTSSDAGPGAISNVGTVSMVGTNVSDNTGGDALEEVNTPLGLGGAGAIANSGSIEASNVTFSGNSGGAGGSSPDGNAGTEGGAGVVTSSGGTVELSNATLSGNTGGPGGFGAQDGGDGGSGAITIGAGAADVTTSTFSGNTGGKGGNVNPSTGGAGAITVRGGGLTITNATVSGNTGGDGGDSQPSDGRAGGIGGSGGLVVTGGTLDIADTTLAANTGGAGGGGSVGEDDGASGAGGLSGAADVQNSILGPNVPDGCVGTATDGGHNLTTNASCPGTLGDPDLQPLGNNGGPTQTMALGSNSDAIDIVPATGAHCPATDQRGATRPAGAACDAGAVEFGAVPPSGGGGGASAPGGPGGSADATAPDTSITSGPDRSKSAAASARRGDKQPKLPSTRDRTPNFSFTSSETGSTFQCSVDAGAFAACSSPFTIPTKLRRGEAHTFAVRAIDRAGNADATPAQLEFKVKKKR